MAKLIKGNMRDLGYGFVAEEYLGVNENEYSRRLSQQEPREDFRRLRDDEIVQLERSGNYSPDWSDVWVTDFFDPACIRNSSFYGWVRIGRLMPGFLEYRDLRLPMGIYNSQVYSCDIGDDVAIHQVNYLAHTIVGNEVILSAIDELLTSPTAKFGNGVVKDGEDADKRIVLELCNENGKRAVIPFEGMQASDAYLWTRYRDDDVLQRRFQEMAENSFDTGRGYYSTIGNHAVIKNSNTIKDVRIGPFAYIKGVNKLKNVTVNSSEEAATQIGEGCELVNGIIGFGCRIFYGVKAVRFVLSSFSQLKYGARLINSFLGDNSTVSCCEVLNSLIFPAHEQHHNNSFLCAALIKGQSNMAAGATVGSNHNSRGADGEIIAERGFWPGLCVSLKHNSRFASYTLIVKGDFLYELDIRLPFSLVSLDLKKDQLVVLPGYWFLYNAYALMRNTGKFADRDRRKLKNQFFEYDVLAPDTVNEMFDGIRIIERAVGTVLSQSQPVDDTMQRAIGRAWLLDACAPPIDTVWLEGAECSERKVRLAKPREAYQVYRRMIIYYVGMEVFGVLRNADLTDLRGRILESVGTGRSNFDNVGGQLIPKAQVDALLREIKMGSIKDWEDVHHWYHRISAAYPQERGKHALACYEELFPGALVQMRDHTAAIVKLLEETIVTKRWLCEQIFTSREKDYTNSFRNMVYDSDKERDRVVGALSDNGFINAQNNELQELEQEWDRLKVILKSFPD